MNKVDHFLKNNIGLNNLLNNNIPGLNKNHVCRAIKKNTQLFYKKYKIYNKSRTFGSDKCESSILKFILFS